VQKALAAKEKELSDLQAKIQELGRKENDLRNEKVSDNCVFTHLMNTLECMAKVAVAVAQQ